MSLTRAREIIASMQSPTHNSDRASHQRQRCGGCTHFCPRTQGDELQMRQGICALTNGDLKQPGTVSREALVCIFRPSKFKPKEFRL